MASKSTMIKTTLEHLAYLDKECCYFTASLESTLPTDSKIGGVPYIPRGAAVPVSSEGKRLRMIAQINLEQLPAGGFPLATGILQFWGMDHEYYGACFAEPCQNDTARVIYHDKILEHLCNSEVFDMCPEYAQPALEAFPVGVNGCKLTARLGMSPLSSSDFHFDELFMRVYRKLYPGEPEKHFWQIQDDDEDFYNINSLGHKLLGHPDFTQTDPRDRNNYCEYILLLQLDTDMIIDPDTGESSEILWGDFGVGNWFIRPCDLAVGDFSRVLFNWDC